MLQDLRLVPGESVLEIGTGSAYFTALLAGRGARVTSVEINPRLAGEAAAQARPRRHPRRRAAHRRRRARLSAATFDAIVLTASTPVLPDSIVAQLKPGGRVFAVVGDAPVMTARIVEYVGPGSWTTTDLFETVIDPLVNAAAPARFTF